MSEDTENPQQPETREAAAEKPQGDSKTKQPTAKTSGHAAKKTESEKGGAKKPSKKSDSAKSSGIGYGLFTLLLLLVLIALGVGGYEFWIMDKLQKNQRQVLNNQSSLQRQLELVEQLSQETKTDLQSEVTARKDIQAQQDALNTALEDISRRLGRTTVAWRLAEVEYLLTIGGQRLAITGDRDTVVQIFRTADQRLHAIGDPGLIPVRKAVADELTALQSLQLPDIPGMALTLGSLISQVNELPLIDTERIAAATDIAETRKAKTWKDLPAAVWEDIKSLVQVRRQQQPTEPLLPPKEAWYLTQNLRLKLEQARLALLDHDTTLFRNYLKDAESWVTSFYDQDSGKVQNLLKTLNDLAETELTAELPDVSESLQLLRDYMSRQELRLNQDS